MDWQENHGMVFGGPGVIALCFWWTLFWQFVSGRLLQLLLPCDEEDLAEDPSNSRFSAKLSSSAQSSLNRDTLKVRRRLIFALVVAPSSVVLLTFCCTTEGFPRVLLVSSSVWHQLLFAVAFGHWVNALAEDWCPRFSCLTFSLEFSGERVGADAKSVSLLLSSARYLVLLGCYGALCTTLSLGGLGAVLLLLEVPSIFALRRDLAIVSQSMPCMALKRPLDVRWARIGTTVVFAFLPLLCLLSIAISGEGRDLFATSLRWQSQVVFCILTLTSVVTMVGLGVCSFRSSLPDAPRDSRKESVSSAHSATVWTSKRTSSMVSEGRGPRENSERRLCSIPSATAEGE